MKKVIILLIVLIPVLAGCCPSNDKICTARESYQTASSTCGADNIQQHDYNDGSKDFDCADYSKIK